MRGRRKHTHKSLINPQSQRRQIWRQREVSRIKNLYQSGPQQTFNSEKINRLRRPLTKHLRSDLYREWHKQRSTVWQILHAAEIREWRQHYGHRRQVWMRKISTILLASAAGNFMVQQMIFHTTNTCKYTPSWQNQTIRTHIVGKI